MVFATLVFALFCHFFITIIFSQSVLEHLLIEKNLKLSDYYPFTTAFFWGPIIALLYYGFLPAQPAQEKTEEPKSAE